MTPDHEVAIIGAGLSGLGMGAALRRAGIEDFVILERAGDVGGTWRDNTYPGIGVDIPTFAYQFSYELKPDWSRVFAEGREVKGYIDDYVDRSTACAAHPLRQRGAPRAPGTRSATSGGSTSTAARADGPLRRQRDRRVRRPEAARASTGSTTSRAS